MELTPEAMAEIKRDEATPCNQAGIVDAPKPPNLKQQLHQAHREGWGQAKREAVAALIDIPKTSRVTACRVATVAS